MPVGIAGIVLVTLFIDDVREPAPGRFDVLGFLLSGIGLSSLMFGLEFASRGVGSIGITVTLLVLGVVSGLAYWRHARGGGVADPGLPADAGADVLRCRSIPARWRVSRSVRCRSCCR